MVEHLENAPSYGIHPSALTIDSAQLLANVRTEVDRLNALHMTSWRRPG